VVPRRREDAMGSSRLRGAAVQECEMLLIRKEDMTNLTWSGLVRHGVWRGSRVVIRKVMRKSPPPERLEEFLRHMLNLVELNCPHIMRVRVHVLAGDNRVVRLRVHCCWRRPLQVIGYTVEPDCGLAFEQSSLQPITLQDWCLTQECIDDIADRSVAALAIAVRVKIVEEVAAALVYLRDNRLLHGDIKSWSVYMESRRGGLVVTRLGDYGLVRTQEQAAELGVATESVASHAADYMPPEQWLDALAVTPAADVYAVGVLLAEVMQGRRGVTWKGCPSSDRMAFARRVWINQRCVSGQRPDVPKSLPETLALLLKDCWTQRPQERVSVGDLYAKLHALCWHSYNIRALTTTVVDLPPYMAPEHVEVLTPRRRQAAVVVDLPAGAGDAGEIADECA
jgi:serine/threonine protein kinase